MKSTPFIIILLAALLNTVPYLIFNATEGYGNSTLPVTYWILDGIAGTLYIFMIALITLFAGVLVWKNRDTRTDEIFDSLPTPDWISYASRLTALLGMVLLVQLLALLSGVIVQASYGFHRYQLSLYLTELILRDGSLFLFFAVLAFFIHTLAPNKYVGYFAYIAFLIANAFIWKPLNVATNLVQFGARPNVTYSDFYDDAPYRLTWRWFTLYWLLFCALLAVTSIMFWPRGKPSSWRERWHSASLRFHGGWRPITAALVVLFLGAGAWIDYNTRVLNRLYGPKDLLRAQADYEKTYKTFEKMEEPRVRGAKYAIDLFPETRNIVMRGEEVLENPYAHPLSEVHFSVSTDYDTAIEIPGASLTKDDSRLYYRIYLFTPPLAPGERRTVNFTVKTRPRGFENEVTGLQVVQNGTFFDNSIGPNIGYESGRELGDPNDRKKYGLKEQERMPPLERDCTADCMDSYLGGHADWVDMETVISTSRIRSPSRPARSSANGGPAAGASSSTSSTISRSFSVLFCRRGTKFCGKRGTASGSRSITTRTILGTLHA